MYGLVLLDMYTLYYIYITYMSNCVFYIFFIHLIIIYYIYTYLHYDLSISVNPLNCICIYLLLYVATLYYIYIYITLYAGLVLWYTTSPVIFFLIFCLLCISSIIIYIDGRYFDTTILHCPYIYTYIHYYIHIIVPLLHYVSIYTSCIFYSNDYTLK
jgi:hypothetical protein